MKICAICTDELSKRNRFEITELCTENGVEIYKVAFRPKNSKRAFARFAKTLVARGVSFVAVPADFPFLKELSDVGLSPVDGRGFFIRNLSDAAICAARHFGKRPDFFIRGGSFFTATRTALCLLSKNASVSVSCADADAVSEAIFEDCGAVVLPTPTPDAVTIHLFEDSPIIEVCGKTFGFRDFSFSFPEDAFPPFPDEIFTAVAEILEICGFSTCYEIKTELLTK